jgi:hypothetical protein
MIGTFFLAFVVGARRPERHSGIVRVITAPYLPHLLWVGECLKHLSSHAQAITRPAWDLAEQRRLPWWR